MFETELLNEHIDAILCREGIIIMTDEKIAIIDSRIKDALWTTTAPRRDKSIAGEATANRIRLY